MTSNLELQLGPRVALRGVCLLTPERAQRGYRLSKFLAGLRHAANRDQFAADAVAYMRAMGLSEYEQSMVQQRDYNAMLDYGASAVALGKASPALGTNLLARGAGSMGMTVEAFIQQRKQANKGYPWEF
ncbi:MAG: hypothetical protein ACI4QS_07240 [Comamonas sp.]